MRAALAIAAIALAAGSAVAAPDYSLESADWNGLGTLWAIAREAGCELKADNELDWSSLDGSDVLWFIYPRAQVEGQKLVRFLQAGGRAVIADDFGAAASALEALGIRRGRAPRDATLGYHKNPNLPVAKLRLQTELGRATQELTANHPAAFQSAIPATYELEPGAALVVEGRVGKGQFVAIADPSVLINNMLELDGNRAFARALVEHTCRAGHDRVHVYTQAFRQYGQPPATLGAGAATGEPFGDFNAFLHRLDSRLKDAFGKNGLVAGLGAGLALLALLVFAGTFPQRLELRDTWTRAGMRTSRLGPVRDPAELLDWAGPAAVLRDETVTRLQATLGAPLDFDWVGPQELERKVAARAGARAGGQAAELWRLLHRIRWRTVDGDTIPDERVGRRALLRLHRAAAALFASLDEAPRTPERTA